MGFPIIGRYSCRYSISCPVTSAAGRGFSKTGLGLEGRDDVALVWCGIQSALDEMVVGDVYIFALSFSN